MNKTFYMLSIALISCLGIIVYSNTFRCCFHFDDFIAIVGNPAIKDIQNLVRIWEFYPSRFMTFLSFSLNYRFNGLDVVGYHLFNLALHLISALLAWWLTLLTLSTPAIKGNKITEHSNLIALFVGLIFVSHPLQTQAVTYIWQRAASMATMFYLASLCFYAKSRLLENKDERRPYYIFSLIMAVTAMYTKEMAATLPLMVLLYEFIFFKTKKNFNWSSYRTLVVTRQYLLPFLFILFIIPLTVLLVPPSIRIKEMAGVTIGRNFISPVHYLLTQFRVMVTYIRLVFAPLNQNLDYDYPISKNLFEMPTLISFSFLIIILFWAKNLFSKYRLVSFSVFWFFLTLLPESSVFPLQDVIVEHRLYLPLVGYSIFLVTGVYYLFQKNTIKTTVIVLMMVLVCNSVLTYQRNKVWKDELTLWSDTVQKSPHNARAFNNRGIIYATQKSFTQAVSDFTKAAEIDPRNADAFYNRGLLCFEQGNFTKALLDYTKAIEIDPQYAAAYNNRAVDYYQLENYDKAWDDVRKAQELNAAIDPVFLKELKFRATHHNPN